MGDRPSSNPKIPLPETDSRNALALTLAEWPGRTEWAIVLLLTIAGGWLRGKGLAAVGLSHFDEGIYALSGLWPYSGRFEPNQGFYSPPVFPVLVGLANLAFGGPVDTAAIAVSWVFGMLTIPLVWLFGRTWWSAPTGLLAAGIVAVDNLHVGFSRMALTDATFSFFFLASLLATMTAMVRGGVRLALLAGLLAGFTWNIKYNGFVCVAMAGCLLLPAGKAHLAAWSRRVKVLAAVGALTLAVYLPWAAWFHVKHEGGYAALVQHQRGYWAGPAAVYGHLCDFASSQAAFRMPAFASDQMFHALVSPAGRAILACCLAATFLVGMAMGRLPFPAAAGIVAIALALPAMYAFYLRLWLPTDLLFMIAVCGLAFPSERRKREPGDVLTTWQRAAGMVIAACWLVPAAASSATGPVGERLAGVQGARGYREAAAAIGAEIESRRDSAVAAFVRPPLLYYLALAGRNVLRLPDSEAALDNLPDRSLLLVDSAVRDSPGFSKAFERRMDQFELRGRYRVDCPLTTLLDDVRAFQLANPIHEPTAAVYQKKSGGKP